MLLNTIGCILIIAFLIGCVIAIFLGLKLLWLAVISETEELKKKKEELEEDRKWRESHCKK